MTHPQVDIILKNTIWGQNRVFEETRHRQLLLDQAKKFHPKWLFYFDADERFEDINKKELLESSKYDQVDGIQCFLFDAYMTLNDCEPVIRGEQLHNRRKFFGPEYREVLVLWRNLPHIYFQGLDAREPAGCQQVISDFFCQHYGKAVSIEEWEKTCDYYSKHFPEPYKSKWLNRKGKAIHCKSDFGQPLYNWKELKRKNSLWKYI